MHFRLYKSFLFCSLLFICGAAQAASLEDLYRQAVEDASVVEHGEIYRNLVGISSPEAKNNPELLRWKEISGEQYVLVCTLAGGYLQGKNWKSGQVAQLSKTDNLWVTAVPELKNFFKERGLIPTDHDSLLLRIKQLLGLPAGEDSRLLVEFWVRPADLFRPCPDSDPADHEAQLSYPWKSSPFQIFNSDRLIHSYVDEDHPDVILNYKQWYENLNATTYSAETPYPWTQLGYTYDWSDDRFNNGHIGLSEFIVIGGSKIVIENVVTVVLLDNYFGFKLPVKKVH